MNDLKRQIRLAHQRLILQRFVAILPQAMSFALLAAVVAILLRKLFPIPVSGSIWAISWIGGAVVIGFVAAIVLTVARRDDEMTAAIEIDRRCGLRERVASCLSLTEQQQDSAAGQALIRDATRRASRVDVSEEFRLRGNRWSWAPVLLGCLTFALTLFTDAQPDSQDAQATAVSAASEKDRVKASAKQLIKRTEMLKREAEKKGLKEAENLFRKIEVSAEALEKKQDVDRERALVKMNELAKQLQDRKRTLLGRDEVRKQLNSLSAIKQGPADRMAQAMKKGDFKRALQEVKRLQDAMKQGKLSAEQQKQLQSQLAQMQDKLQQIADAHRQATEQLQRQIQQKIAQGDRAAAGELQQQLDRMEQQAGAQAKKMDRLAQQLGQAAKSMQEGQMPQADAALGDAADSLSAMQQELDEMAMLEQAMDMISDAKGGMNCQACQGAGCSECGGGLGDGGGQNGLGDGGRRGLGMGQGQGQGERPEQETEFGSYESRVRAKPQQGSAVFGGEVDGPSRPGQAIEGIKQAIQAAASGKDDPLTGQRLPKPQRELTRDYFRALNGEP